MMAPGKKAREKKGPDPKPETGSLREYAERQVATSAPAPAGRAEQSADELIHELQVHQVELEIQSEELRRAQLALEESRDKYLDLYEFAPLGYLTLTGEGFIREVNLTGAMLLGIERKKLIHIPFSRVVAGSERDAWHRYFMDVLGREEKLACTLGLLQGGNRVFAARLESIRIADQTTGTAMVRVTFSDISDLKQLEEALVRKSDELFSANETLTTTLEKLRLEDKALKVSLAEREALLAEIHHRVKNNLAAFISLLSLQGSVEETPAERELKDELRNRARSMALIHETLFRTNQFSNVAMEQYLSNLVGQIVNSYGPPPGIRTVVQADGIALDLARATPLGLIVNELVTNSIKHAFPKDIRPCLTDGKDPCLIEVRLAKEDGSYVLNIHDNGVGIPAGLDPLTTKTLGLKLVTFLAKHQLRAGVEINTVKGTGFVFRFTE
jgi:PAS domain S-box-containing protein